MITVHKSETRGNSIHDWLDSYHSFSFAEYYNPDMMGYGYLRVINEDFIKAGTGFPMHAHNDMEIITYVVSGSLAHKDSMGNGSIIRSGDIQRMSAGTGIRHSEFNASNFEALHLLQIWIVPENIGISPGYEQKQINKSENQLILIGSHTGSKNAVVIHQKINLYVAYCSKNAVLEHKMDLRNGWLQLIKGSIQINDVTIAKGDGLAIAQEAHLKIQSLQDQSEFLLFDMF